MIPKTTPTPAQEPVPRSAGNLARGAAAASVTGLVFLMSPAHQAIAADNPYEQRFGGDNPLYAPIGLEDRSHPAVADIDADGDLDLFIGAEDGTIAYFENTGTASDPEFTRRTGTANPFSGVDIDDGDSSDFAAPAFADLDEDDDLDAAVGADDGYLYYFENTGTSSVPAFTLRSGSDNPLWYNNGDSSVPHFADVDGDTDPDVVVGRSDGYLNYLENNGDGSFSPYSYNQTQNPFYLAGAQGYAAPALFADIDNDGDADWFAGNSNGYLYYLENDGAGGFTAYDDSDTRNPFFDVDVGRYAAPVFADLDNDGDLDAIVGEDGYILNYFENLGSNADPFWAERTGTRSPFYGFDEGRHSRVTFADIDGDGDKDAFALGGEGLSFLENTGTAAAPVFVKREGTANPLQAVNEAGEEAGDLACVALADIDGDGDLDAFVGNTNYTYERVGKYYTMTNSGSIAFYENTGTATVPVFEKKGDAANPLFFVEDPNYSLVFADIDGDGDLDAFGGATAVTYSRYAGGGGPEAPGPYSLSLEADIHFYKNVGDQQNPGFNRGSSNPLAYIFEEKNADYDLTFLYSLAFGDIDGDGDLDAVVGSLATNKYGGGDQGPGHWPGSLELYENAGGATDPGFVPVAEANDRFAEIQEESDNHYLSPAFVDIDGDGDLDVFFGEEDGRFLYFENTTVSGDGSGASGAAITGSGSGGSCFVDTAGSAENPAAVQESRFQQVVRRVYTAFRSLWR